MADHSKTFEITIAALGMIVTGLLGYGQLQLSRGQAKLSEEQARQAVLQAEADQRRAEDNIEVQVMSLVSPHLGNLAKPGTEFEPSQRVVLAAANYLTSAYGHDGLATMADKIVQGNKTISQEVKTQFREVTVAAPLTGKWFAVLASLPETDEASAKRLANQRLEQVKDLGLQVEIQLFKTKISHNIAVVVGGPLDRNGAIDLASQARTNGLASDAFVQQDRGWTYVGKAPF